MENLHNKALCINKDLAGVFFSSFQYCPQIILISLAIFLATSFFSDKVAFGDLTLGWINSDYPLFDRNV